MSFEPTEAVCCLVDDEAAVLGAKEGVVDDMPMLAAADE